MKIARIRKSDRETYGLVRDGKIATKSKKSKWITNSVSRQHGHMLRAQNDCMLVGRGTIVEDNPSLDCRLSGLESFSPDLFILDSTMSIPNHYKIFSNHSRNVFVLLSRSTNWTLI